MNGVLSPTLDQQPAATAVLSISPRHVGILGSVEAPAGGPVPIAHLLGHVLARYGLPTPEDLLPPTRTMAARLTNSKLFAPMPPRFVTGAANHA